MNGRANIDNRLTLQFVDSAQPELSSAEFSHSLIGERRVSVRGKSIGAYDAHGSFQWTRGVIALAALVLREKLFAATSKQEVRLLIGGNGSLAASLDDSITKNTVWLLDMFGVDSLGQPMIRRAIRRSNSGRKLPGPTALSLNQNFLPTEGITIVLNGEAISTEDALLVLLSRIERIDE